MFRFAPWQNHISFIELICLVANWLYIKAVRIGTIDGLLIKPFQSLIIRKHQISVIEDDALLGLAELAVLKIMECGLSSMPPVFDVKDTLYELYLNTNNISYVANDYFRGFKRLHHLSLTDNSLTELPDLTHLKTTLQILHAERNIITHFPNWMLNMSMEKLSNLYISQNRIQEFSSIMLSLQRQLQYIDLSLNGLTTVPQYHDVTWASYQIRKIAGCACAGNAGNVFPRRRFQRKPLVSDPGMHHGTCVTHVPWYMSGSLTCGDGENVPGIPGACAPAILRIWQEAHG